MNTQKPYCLSPFSYHRILSREVKIGDIALGGSNPIRIQSMTTTDTMDTLGTVEQSIRMVEAGCEYVRITAPSKKEAANLAEIKKELRRRGYKIPLIADIHFTPNAAEIAARIVEKVRVNPGNYADKKKFETIDYTDISYQAELSRIYERFSPLVKICKEEGTVLRIGTNHGSLSDRIMSRYGDTPMGMVESAMEFVRICEDHGFYDIVISMKASNPQVMVQAYRLLMQQMLTAGQVYPLHLGVTEAGEGEDGRIKSALGIATLLMDGIGDTVRVSLTEDPEYEVPVAKFLVDYFVRQAIEGKSLSEINLPDSSEVPWNPYTFKRRESREVLNFGHTQVPRVIADIRHNAASASSLKEVGYTYIPALDKYNFSDIAADFVYMGNFIPPYELPGGLKKVFDYSVWRLLNDRKTSFPFFESATDYIAASDKSEELNFINISSQNLEETLSLKEKLSACVLILSADKVIPAYEWRQQIKQLIEKGFDQPLILKMAVPDGFFWYEDDTLPHYVRISPNAQTQLSMASDGSTLLVDGLVDGIWLEEANDCRVRAAFGMLQLARLRITKTEYISCPSCGRTLFDLQETTARIRRRTEHLKGVKIGIMGCVVNGPGEMADADYGYVGVGPDKIALYRGQEVVERGVRTADAVDKLIDLIKEDGNWVEPVVAEQKI
ncbi:MAG: (E)-4-hydroxy-3-methylbut-2-enyl-diphosphate synthase [Bacteroidia bacterium]|nr:(E)-4-hydroxy-3-methylbut-2-enyl-diphosphate synthase [Bacteroidia bacterium]